MAGKVSQVFETIETRCSNSLLLTKRNETDYVLLQKEIRLLLEQLKYRPTRISVFGIYNITFSTFLKLLGHMSTYIIIALQVSSSS